MVALVTFLSALIGLQMMRMGMDLVALKLVCSGKRLQRSLNAFAHIRGIYTAKGHYMRLKRWPKITYWTAPTYNIASPRSSFTNVFA